MVLCHSVLTSTGICRGQGQEELLHHICEALQLDEDRRGQVRLWLRKRKQILATQQALTA